MHRLLIAFALPALLTACMPGSSPEDRAVAVTAADDRLCQSYGAQPWTQAYIRCRLAINGERELSGAAVARGVARRGWPRAPAAGPSCVDGSAVYRAPARDGPLEVLKNPSTGYRRSPDW